MGGYGRQRFGVRPAYALDEGEIRKRVADAREAVRDLLAVDARRFVWRTYAGPHELIEARLTAAEGFLADFPRGRAAGRYLACALPRLPLPTGPSTSACARISCSSTAPPSTPNSIWRP